MKVAIHNVILFFFSSVNTWIINDIMKDITKNLSRRYDQAQRLAMTVNVFIYFILS